ncbi:MAG: Wzz/FepE/Etk N-terminal domain-containing protein, partial [Methylocystis sp.]|nr:Wzz/FepE/Etk N-terminal domain-containing protein [Methylocystis sp.]
MARNVQTEWLAEHAPPTGKNDGTAVDINDLFEILVSRWPLLIRCLALTTALAIAYALLWPKTYTAKMSIIVDPRERVPASVDAAPMPQNPDAALVESQIRLLTSRNVLKRVVESQDLARSGDASSINKIFAATKSLLGYPPVDLTQNAVEALETAISAKRSERSYVIDVEVKGKT